MSTLAVAALALAIPFLPFAGLFGFVRIPLTVLLLILGIAAAYIAAVELLKRWFHAREPGAR